MAIEFDLQHALDFGAALLIGALIGLEREKRLADGDLGTAGLRSFVLLAQLGAVGGYLGQQLEMAWILPATVVAVAGLVVAGYLVAARARPDSVGLTSELAAVTACMLGALSTTGHRELAVCLGIVSATLLAYKESLHDAAVRVPRADVLAVLRLLGATFIVLPLLPDRALDPWGAINPYKLWLLVLLISGMSLVGYIASRVLGSGRGVVVTAVTGGLVSSTALTLAFTKQSHEEGNAPGRLAGGILLAWGIMFVRVIVAATVVHAPMFAGLIVPFGAMAVTCVLAAWLGTRGTEASAAPDVPVKNPFSLVSAGKFALLFGVVQLLVKLAQQYVPGSGTYVVAAVAGLTDVDAITLAMAEQARSGGEGEMRVAVIAIVIAAFSNTLVKSGMAVGMGRGMTRVIVPAAVAVLLAGGAALLFA